MTVGQVRGDGQPATAADGSPVAVVHRSVARSLVEAVRPRQWIKNLLVLAAPVAALPELDVQVALATALAFVTFTMASAGTYLMNDVQDRARDAMHPVKRHRPLARGDVPVPLARLLAVLLLGGSVAAAVLLGNLALGVCLAVYVIVMHAYSHGLKDEPVVDLAIVASGFLLRAIAGGLAAGLPLSQWFLIVTTFGSLFMVAGKRYSELVSLGPAAARVRVSHEAYTPSYLRFVWGTSAAVALVAYCLWAFEVAAQSSGETTAPWSALSVAPFLVGVLRYALDVDRATAAEPEDIVLRDRTLQVLVALWLALFVLGALGV